MKTLTFENWYSNIQEEVATVSSTPLIMDVDTIINSLGTLVKELTEELDVLSNELNEADVKRMSKTWQFIYWMPKARRAQRKVNKIKLNVTDLEAAAEDSPNTDQRDKLRTRAKIAKEQAAELQTMVDDRFEPKGELVQRALHSEKIAGQIASIKRASGLEDDPSVLASYKDKMAELQKKYTEDLQAIKELEPSDADKKEAIKQQKEEEAQRLKDQKERDDMEKAANAEAEAKAAKDAKDADSGTQGPQGGEPSGSQGAQGNQGEPSGSQGAQGNQGEPSGSQGAQGNQGEPSGNQGAQGNNTQKIADKTAEIEQLKNDLATENAKETKDDAKISEIEGKIQTANQELDTLRNPLAGESLVIRAKASGLNELATEIESKFDWQVYEGSVLYQKYNEIIRKTECLNTLNESRYENLSVKERFARLM